jgi:hypothetical protein
MSGDLVLNARPTRRRDDTTCRPVGMLAVASARTWPRPLLERVPAARGTRRTDGTTVAIRSTR